MKNNKKLRQMVQLAVLTAILLVMAFTPLGYLKLGPLSITFLTLPVAIATVTLGPAAGLFMGLLLVFFQNEAYIQNFGTSAWAILTALENHDPEEAERMMAIHVSNARDSFFELID